MKKVIFYSMMALVVMSISACEKEDTSDSLNGITSARFNPLKTYGTLTDQDGNVYKTITIGNQTWMAENLRTTKYRDGSAIPEVTGASAWFALSTGAYCNYNNTNNIGFIATYGRLYNWYAFTNSANIAPEGWHVATLEEWEALTSYIGGIQNTGKLKEAGITHWCSENAGSTNQSGFTALPGGQRSENGTFYSHGGGGLWWTANVLNIDFGISLVCSSNSNIESFFGSEELGFSVRCVKD